MSTEFYWIAVAILTTLSASRITRLLTYDKLPPIRWARDAFGDWADKRESTQSWGLLAICPFCMSFWVVVGVLAWAWFAGVLNGPDGGVGESVWWVLNGVFASAYLAAILMIHDGDNGDEGVED